MAIRNLKELILEAQDHKYAIGAFNEVECFDLPALNPEIVKTCAKFRIYRYSVPGKNTEPG